MATNPARHNALLALECLEARAVPAAYSWDAELIAQAYPDAPAPPPAVVAAPAASAMTDVRLASSGADPTTVGPPPSSLRAPLLSSQQPDDGIGNPVVAGRDVLQASHDPVTTAPNHSTDGAKTTTGAETPPSDVNWTPTADYAQVRFASNASGLAFQDWTPPTPAVESSAGNTAAPPPNRLMASDPSPGPTANADDTVAKTDQAIGDAATLADDVEAIADADIHHWLYAST